MVESVLHKWFTRPARVDSIEALTANFRLITLSGEALKQVAWTPGDKVQIPLGGWVQRTYTPMDWDPVAGRFRILICLQADGPGSRWAHSLRPGDPCAIFGPRKSIDLTQLRHPVVFVGDETSFGLARALQGLKAQAEEVQCRFELSTPEALAALEFLNLPFAPFQTDSEAHWLEVEAQIRALIAPDRPLDFVLTGKATTVQRLRKFLRQEGIAASRIHARAYWAPGKKGLD